MTHLRVENYRRLRAYNAKVAGKLDYRRLAITLREGSRIVVTLADQTS